MLGDGQGPRNEALVDVDEGSAARVLHRLDLPDILIHLEVSW